MKDELTNQQWIVMEELWTNSPMYLSELMAALEGKVQWKHTTFLGYLRQLEKKKYVAYETIRGNRLYSAVVSREDCVRQASRSMLSRITDASAALFVSHLINEGHLSREDQSSLRSLIDQLYDKTEEEPDE